MTLTDGRIVVNGRTTVRGRQKRADYVLYHKLHIPLAVVEAKDATQTAGAGMQQALEYAEMLDVPFAISTNGSRALVHDRTSQSDRVEREIELDDLPSPQNMWAAYCEWKGLSGQQKSIAAQDYHITNRDKGPRYYQEIAINRAVEAISKGRDRVLLVMATGTGKTYTAFQIIWRLWKSGVKKRILFLADRNILIDQAKMNDFQPFGTAMTKIAKRQIDKSFEIYLSLYQAVTGSDENRNVYRQFSPDFFDLIVVDECHRGSAKEDSEWREILEYFSSATQIGLTATPKETHDVSNAEYFGDAIFTYSLRQGVEDGFLAPYRVIRYDLDKDLAGYRPEKGSVDRYGAHIEDKVFDQSDFDRSMVLDKRTKLVAEKITEFLRATNPYDKTIVFCETQAHADRMRTELANANPDLVAENHRYVMRMTGSDLVGLAELDKFIDPESRYPVVVTTSKLLSTGVDAKTCKLIVLDQVIRSMTEFKQIIGRGTRIDETHDKRYFTIMDFKRATELFADPDFDGDPVQIYERGEGDPPLPDAIDEHAFAGVTDLQETRAPEPRAVYFVDDVEVTVINKRYQYLDENGSLINESLQAYTKKLITQRFLSPADFEKAWIAALSAASFLEPLEKVGISIAYLRDEVDARDEWDDYDLLRKVAFGVDGATRKQRAARVESQPFFSQFQGRQLLVLRKMIALYVDEDQSPFGNAKILQLKTFEEVGTPVEIVKSIFGGKQQYEAAMLNLKQELYRSSHNE
nr:DEAD/DEAH box helicase family protein [Rhizobium leguminosarum]